MFLGVTCSGHYSTDYVEFSNFIDENESYMNIDFLNFLHPFNAYLPYIYDTYDFSYCETYDNIDFVDMDAVVKDAVVQPTTLYYKGTDSR